MANTFIPGYMAEVTIDGDALADNLGSGTLTRNKNIMTKAVAGAQTPSALAGLITGTISISGHVSTEDIAKLNAAFVSNTALTFVFQMGDSTAPDAGNYSGSALIESLSFAFDADDEWVFTMDMMISGSATYAA